MDKEQENAVKEYQCAGCVSGPFPECFKGEDREPTQVPRVGEVDFPHLSCINHCAGTMIMPGVGRIFLGLPNGFNRIGPLDGKQKWRPYIFRNMKDLRRQMGYDLYNVPIWKYRNEQSHVFVRGMQPRLTVPFWHIILNCTDEEYASITATEVDPEDMD